jgi:AMMECR1 domain-containing protein
LLSQFEPASHPHDWQIGVHGIAIEFHDGKNAFHATYLPEIAAEEGWSHGETITSLIRKSGYLGTMDVEFLDQMVVTRYQSQSITLTYPEYLALDPNGRDD